MKQKIYEGEECMMKKYRLHGWQMWPLFLSGEIRHVASMGGSSFVRARLLRQTTLCLFLFPLFFTLFCSASLCCSFCCTDQEARFVWRSLRIVRIPRGIKVLRLLLSDRRVLCPMEKKAFYATGARKSDMAVQRGKRHICHNS